ncbi:MAG: 16S rRNA (guanine(966)-N(2))-methyltransferase RsmD [Longimicrobiaceae bacterium]
MRIIAGEWGGRRIEAPPGRATRPTADRVREAWLSSVAPWLPGARVLDLFAGSGALGLEALSRGAAAATFVERGPRALRVLRANLAALGAGGRATVVNGDALRYVERCRDEQFAVAFADPPYASGAAALLVGRFLSRPFADLLCVEHGRDAALPETLDSRSRRYGDTVLTFIPAPQ